MKTDTELVLEARQGSQSAFSELVKRHREKAVRLAYVTVGNFEDAKDVSQEAFVKAYRSLGRFEMKSKFSTWFYRILMNTAKDFVRKRRWKNFLIWRKQEEMEGFFERVTDHGPGPEKGLLNKELDHKMTEAIQKLPLKQRWIFTLRFLEGLSLQEIGEATRLAEGTVKAALHFAVQKFKKEIGPYVQGGGIPHGV